MRASSSFGLLTFLVSSFSSLNVSLFFLSVCWPYGTVTLARIHRMQSDELIVHVWHAIGNQANKRHTTRENCVRAYCAVCTLQLKIATDSRQIIDEIKYSCLHSRTRCVRFFLSTIVLQIQIMLVLEIAADCIAIELMKMCVAIF